MAWCPRTSSLYVEYHSRTYLFMFSEWIGRHSLTCSSDDFIEGILHAPLPSLHPRETVLMTCSIPGMRIDLLRPEPLYVLKCIAWSAWRSILGLGTSPL